MKDLARPLRILLRHPRYAVPAVLTLAAGIGVTSAMFGLLDALYFRPLPLTDPHRLVDLTLVSQANRFGAFSYEEFRDIERDASGFQDVIAIGQRGATLNRNGEITRLLIHYVSGRYFPSLGIPMYLGRGFGTADDRAGLPTPQVIINHQLWRQQLGSPPDIIGRTIQLNNTHFTVIGVTAPGFVGLQRPVRTDVWVTTAQAPLVVPGLREEMTNREQRWFRVVGRLSDATDPAEARAALDVIAARWRGTDARAYADARIVVVSKDETRRTEMRQGALFLGLVGLVLLIACANVANLTLARGETRHRELALRAALGATRARLLRHVLVESAIVSTAAACAGLTLAAWLVRLFPTLLPPDASAITLDVRLDTRLLAFTSALAVLATALVGALPAWRGSRTDLSAALKTLSIPRTAGGVQLRDLLVVGEIALSGVIVIAAGLLLRSFVLTLSVNPGFDTRKNVATFYVVPGLEGYNSADTHRFMESARRAAAGVPGVKRASYGIRLPAQGNEAGWSSSFVIPGREPPPGKDAFEIRYTMVGPEYFEVMGTRILSGRGIEERDRPDGAQVAIVSATMARRLWPGESPIGRRIRMGRARPVEREIVGVAEDIRIAGLYEPLEMYVYVPYAQQPQSFGLLLVETEGDVAGVIMPVKQRMAAIDARLPVLKVSSVAHHVDLLLYDDRRNAWVGLAVAGLALTLGAVGVHGVISLVTARRRKEIGIRVALGAGRGRLLRLLLGKGVVLALAGTMLGIAGGLLVGRELRSQLHGISPADPWSIALAAAVLMSVAIGSSVTPAWQASRTDPASALRDD